MPAEESLLLRIAAAGAMATAEELKLVRREVQELGAQTNAAKSKVSGFGGAIKTMGLMTVGAGFVEAVKGATSLQKQMALLHTQAGASTGEVSRMTTGVEKLAPEVGTGPQVLSESLYHVESAGLRGAQALKVLQTAAEGAKVGGANLIDVQNALDGAVVSGIKGVKNYQQAMGALNATVGAGDMSMQDLADAMGKGTLAVAKTFGLAITDVGGALALFGDNNIRGSDAATKLRQSLFAMAAPSKIARAEMDKLGLAPDQLAKDLRKPQGLIVALTDIQKHLQGLTKPQQAAALAQMFGGGKTSAGIMIMLDQLDRLKAKTADVSKGAGGFGEAWAATQKTAAFQLDKLKAQGQALADELGAKVLPFVTGALGKLTTGVQNAVKWIGDLVEGFKKNKTWAIAAVSALVGLAAGAVAIKVVVTAINLWRKAQELLDIVMEANPIGLVIIAVAALAAAFVVVYMKVKWFRNAVNDVWNWLKTAVVNVVKWIGDHWQQLVAIFTGPIGLIVGYVVTHFSQIVNAATGLWHSITSTFSQIGQAIISSFQDAWSFIKGMFNDVKNKASDILNTITSAPGHLLDSINPFKASGGTITRTQNYVVGERGPELVTLPAGAYVHTAGSFSQTGSSAQATSGDVPLDNQITVVLQVNDREMARAVQRAATVAKAVR
jgi:TP901 family phage tail tape measure protein